MTGPQLSDEINDRYLALMHAMQSGVAYSHASGVADSPKHLRVGVNSALVSVHALAALLTEKGVFTVDEYGQSLVFAMEAEVERYEADLSERLGKEVKLQ